MARKKKASSTKEFTLPSGSIVKLKKISPWLLERASKIDQMPEKPTYEVTTGLGTTEIHEHDENTLETDEEKAIWDEYLNEKKRLQAERSERIADAIFYYAVVVTDRELYEGEWREDQEFFGFEIPEDKRDLKVHYVKTTLVQSVEDVTELIAFTMEMAGIQGEVLQEARDSFQRAVDKVS